MRNLLRAAACAAAVAIATPAQAVQIDFEGNRQLNLGLLLQPQFELEEAAAADGESAGKDLTYRVGIFNGLETRAAGVDAVGNALPAVNRTDAPRLAAHVRANLLGGENELFYEGITFGTEPLLSVGFGVDHQTGAMNVASGAADYHAFAGDLFLDLPLPGDMEIVALAAVLRWEHGEGAVVKTEVARVERGSLADDPRLAGTVQAQLLFL